MNAPPAGRVIRFGFLRLHDDASARRETLARELLRELRELCAPHAVWAGIPGDDSAARWDLAFTITLPDLAAWQQLASSEPLRAALARLEAQAAVSKAWTFSQP